MAILVVVVVVAVAGEEDRETLQLEWALYPDGVHLL